LFTLEAVVSGEKRWGTELRGRQVERPRRGQGGSERHRNGKVEEKVCLVKKKARKEEIRKIQAKGRENASRSHALASTWANLKTAAKSRKWRFKATGGGGKRRKKKKKGDHHYRKGSILEPKVEKDVKRHRRKRLGALRAIERDAEKRLPEERAKKGVKRKRGTREVPIERRRKKQFQGCTVTISSDERGHLGAKGGKEAPGGVFNEGS